MCLIYDARSITDCVGMLGNQVNLCMPSCRLLQTLERLVVVRMKWANVLVAGEYWESSSLHMTIPTDYKTFLPFSTCRFCNFMHLSHPSPTLVRDLQASQRLERRKAAIQPPSAGATNGDGQGDLGWTPSAVVGGGGDAGWVPPSHGGNDHGEQDGDSWRPSKYGR